MGETPQPDLTMTVLRRGRGRPRVEQPLTVTLSVRLKTSEYDALCQRASASGVKVSDVSRILIQTFLCK